MAPHLLFVGAVGSVALAWYRCAERIRLEVLASGPSMWPCTTAIMDRRDFHARAPVYPCLDHHRCHRWLVSWCFGQGLRLRRVRQHCDRHFGGGHCRTTGAESWPAHRIHGGQYRGLAARRAGLAAFGWLGAQVVKAKRGAAPARSCAPPKAKLFRRNGSAFRFFGAARPRAARDLVEAMLA